MKKAVFCGVLAFGLTPLFILSGIDWAWAKGSETWIWMQYLGLPAVFIGLITPIALPVWYYRKRGLGLTHVQRAKAAFYGFVMAWGASTMLKAFTNRLPREPFEALGSLDFSSSFRFGFLQGANLWESLIEGYPSGHTMTAFAMSVALFPFLQTRQAKRWALLYALYIGWGVSVTVHWLSDAVAGGLIGVSIGILISTYLKDKP